MKLFAAALLVLLAPARAEEYQEVDLARVERTIQKEPPCVAQPLHALFILDAERDRLFVTLIARDAAGREVRSRQRITAHC